MKKSQVALAIVPTDSTTGLSLDNLSIVNSIGVDLGLIDAKQGEINVLKENINQKIVVLFNRKVVIGRYSNTGKGCAYAIGFIDSCVNAGIAKGTAQKVYLPTFKKAVESGKPVKDWNGYRQPVSNGTKKGNAKGKGKSTLSNLLVKAFNHDEGKSFEELCANVQKQFFDEAKFETVYECFVDYLKSEGFEVIA